MKIGVFTEVYRPIINGVVASVESLTEELRARGHEAYTFAPRIPNGVEALGRVFFMPSLPLPARTEYRLTVPLVARRNKAQFLSQCDVIHSHSLFVTGWMAQYYARYRFRVPLVFTYHTMLERYTHYSPLGQRFTTQLTRELTRGYANAADAVIAPTQAVAAGLREAGVIAPICVVPTGIELERFRSASGAEGRAARLRFGIPSGAPLMLLVCRLAHEKSIPLAFEALKLLRADLPGTRLLLVGAGPSSETLKAHAKAEGLGEAVIFTGALPHEDLPALYAAADVFVFPSTSETQGLVLAEAFAAGLPVVAAASPQTRDVFGPNLAGELVEDAGGMADAIRGLLQDRARYNAAAAHARTASAAFDIKATAGRVVAVYQAVMANRAGTAAMGDFEDLFDLVGLRVAPLPIEHVFDYNRGMLAPTLIPTAGETRHKAPAGARGDCQAHIAVVRCGAGRGIAALALLDRAGSAGEHFIPFSVREQPSQQGRDYAYAGVTAALDRMLSLGVRRALIHVDDPQLIAELEQRSQPHRELTLPYIVLGCKLNEFANAKLVLVKPERLAALRAKAEGLAAPFALLPTG